MTLEIITIFLLIKERDTKALNKVLHQDAVLGACVHALPCHCQPGRILKNFINTRKTHEILITRMFIKASNAQALPQKVGH